MVQICSNASTSGAQPINSRPVSALPANVCSIEHHALTLIKLCVEEFVAGLLAKVTFQLSDFASVQVLRARSQRNSAMYLLLAAAVVTSITVYVVRTLFFPLPETENIPTIPFWVGMLPLFKDVDQQDVFRAYIDKPLRTHGAAKIFFASQWNVLIHRPTYLAEVFKQTDVYEKSGNQNKIPHSVLASLFGDNIISSHGDNWKKYQKVIKPGLQARPNVRNIWVNAASLGDTLLKYGEGSKAIRMPAIIRRYSISNFTDVFFGANFEVSRLKQHILTDG